MPYIVGFFRSRFQAPIQILGHRVCLRRSLHPHLQVQSAVMAQGSQVPWRQTGMVQWCSRVTQSRFTRFWGQKSILCSPPAPFFPIRLSCLSPGSSLEERKGKGDRYKKERRRALGLTRSGRSRNPPGADSRFKYLNVEERQAFFSTAFVQNRT